MVLDRIRQRLGSEIEVHAQSSPVQLRQRRMRMKHGLVAVALLTGLVYFVYFRHSSEQQTVLGSQEVRSSATRASSGDDIPNDRVAAFANAFDKLGHKAKAEKLEDHGTGYPTEYATSLADKEGKKPKILLKITPAKTTGGAQKVNISRGPLSSAAPKPTEAGRQGNETFRQRLITQLWGPGSREEAIKRGSNAQNRYRNVIGRQRPAANVPQQLRGVPQQEQLAIPQQKQVMPRRPFIKVPQQIQRAMPRQPAVALPQQQEAGNPQQQVIFNPQQVVIPQQQQQQQQQQAGMQRGQPKTFDDAVKDAAKMFEDVRQKGLMHLQSVAGRVDTRQKALPWEPAGNLAPSNIEQRPPAAARDDGNDRRAVAGRPAANPDDDHAVDANVLQRFFARQADGDGVRQGGVNVGFNFP